MHNKLMHNKLKKIIAIVVIYSLLFGRDIVVFAEGEAPTRAPQAASEPSASSAPAPTSPPSEAKPTSPPLQPLASQPTSPLQPTSQAAPTSQSLPTSNPQPTYSSSQSSSAPPQGSSLPTSNPSPTGDGTSSQSTDSQQSAQISGAGGDGTSSPSGSVNDPANTFTGPGSTNFGSEKNQNWEDTVNKNLAQMQNKIDTLSSTGFNTANLNTVAGQVFTGDSQTSLNLLNKLNSTITGLGGFSVFNVFGTYNGDIVFKLAEDNSNGPTFANASATVAKNAVTGPASTNIADSQNGFVVKEANGNDAKLTNDISLKAVTGGNSTSFNTGGGFIKTGNASVLGNIINLANTNLNVSKWLFGVVNIFGTLVGNIVLPKDTNAPVQNVASNSTQISNTGTGPLSTNIASSTDTNQVTFTNANTAQITSNLDVSANSGDNNASFSTGGGSITTGDTKATISNTTIANTNAYNPDGTVWLVIVNEMGNWVGHILGTPWGDTAASNVLPIVQSTGGSGAYTTSSLAQNTVTGPLSENISSLSSSNEATYSASNSAEIINTIKASADTGSNDASFNTGASDIQTGTAKTGLNLVNMANTNVVAKKFVTILVNNLGSFLGDIIPPDKHAENTSPKQSESTGQTTTADQLPTFAVATGSLSSLGGSQTHQQSPTQNQTTGQTNSADQAINQTQFTQAQDTVVQYAAVQYQQAVSQVAYAQAATQKKAIVLRRGVPTRQQVTNQIHSVENQAVQLKHGIFLSPAFAKATETTGAGILFGGASLKVNQTWLSFVPVAIVLFFLRRRKRYDVVKIINSFMEVIL